MPKAVAPAAVRVIEPDIAVIDGAVILHKVALAAYIGLNTPLAVAAYTYCILVKYGAPDKDEDVADPDVTTCGVIVMLFTPILLSIVVSGAQSILLAEETAAE